MKKTMDKSRRLLSLLAVGILSLSMIITGVGFKVARSGASVGFYAVYASHQLHTEALFTQSGINQNVATAITNMLASSHIGGPDQTRNASAFSNFASAGVTQTYGGVYIRLFDENISPAGQVAGAETTNRNLFTRSGNAAHGTVGEARWWRVVNLHNGILTLWMADPYRNSAFNTTSTPQNGIEGNIYHHANRNSTIRQNLLSDFNAVMNAITDVDIRAQINSAIVPAGNAALAGTNTNENFSNTRAHVAGTNTTNPMVPFADRVWLPSTYEVFNTSTTNLIPAQSHIGGTNATVRTGQWQLNAYDRGFAVVLHSWLRSGLAGFGNDTPTTTTTGNISLQTVSHSFGVRPAIHINVASLARATIDAGLETGSHASATVRSPAINGGTAQPGPISITGQTANITFDAGLGHTINGLNIRGAGVTMPTSTEWTAWTTIPGNGTTPGEYRLQRQNNDRELSVELRALNASLFTSVTPLMLRATTMINNYSVAMPDVSGILGIQGVGAISTGTVEHGQGYSFTMTLAPSHTNRGGDQIVISRANAGSVAVNGTGSNRTVTVANVTGNIDEGGWTINGLGSSDLNTYTVAPPTVTVGGTAVAPPAVIHGEDITVTINLAPGFENTPNASIQVTATGSGVVGAVTGSGTTRTVQITNITANITAITISGIVGNMYTIPATMNFTGGVATTPNTTVNHPGTATFTLNLDAQYINTPSENINILFTGGGSPTIGLVKGTGHLRTVTVSNITASISDITVTGLQVNTYMVTWQTQSGQGFTVSPEPSSSSPVIHGGNFSFRVNLEAGYEGAVVRVNSVVAVASAGVFTISNITENQVITVSVATANYTVTWPTAPGFTIVPESSVPVAHGGSFSFRVNISPGYQSTNMVVRSNGAMLTPLSGLFTIPTIYENQEITITGVEARTYTINFVTNAPTVEAPRIVGYGELITQPSITNGLMILVGWYTTPTFDVNTRWNFATDTVEDNVTLYALWTAQQFTVTFITNGGSPVAQRNVTGGSLIGEVSTTRPGFLFQGWFTTSTFDDGSQWIVATSLVTGNTRLYARWQLDTAQLVTAINQADAKKANSEYFTAVSVENLQKAIDYANEMLKTASTPGQITSAVDTLNVAINGLRIDTTILRKLMEKPIFPQLFTSSSYNMYVATFNAAADWLNDTKAADITLEDLQDHVYDLQTAIDNLVPQFDLNKEGMTQEEFWDWLEEIRNIINGGTGSGNQTGSNPGDYTPESWDEYQRALEELKNLLESSTSTIEELRDALAKLEAAKNALVKRPEKTPQQAWMDENLWWVLIIAGGSAGLLAGLLFVIIDRTRRRG